MLLGPRAFTFHPALLIFAIQQLPHGLAARFIDGTGVFAVFRQSTSGAGGGVHFVFATLRAAVGKAWFAGLEFELLFTHCADFDRVAMRPSIGDY